MCIQIRIFRSIKSRSNRDLNVLACGLNLNLTSKRVILKLKGLPLEPYPWVDTNWGSDQDYRFRKKVPNVGSEKGSEKNNGSDYNILFFKLSKYLSDLTKSWFLL